MILDLLKNLGCGVFMAGFASHKHPTSPLFVEMNHYFKKTMHKIDDR